MTVPPSGSMMANRLAGLRLQLVHRDVALRRGVHRGRDARVRGGAAEQRHRAERVDDRRHADACIKLRTVHVGTSDLSAARQARTVTYAGRGTRGKAP